MLYCLPEVCGDLWSLRYSWSRTEHKSCKAIGLSPSWRGRKTSGTARCGEIKWIKWINWQCFFWSKLWRVFRQNLISEISINIFSIKTLNLILWTISKTSENVLSPNLLICSWPFHGFALLNFRSDRRILEDSWGLFTISHAISHVCHACHVLLCWRRSF